MGCILLLACTFQQKCYVGLLNISYTSMLIITLVKGVYAQDQEVGGIICVLLVTFVCLWFVLHVLLLYAVITRCTAM